MRSSISRLPANELRLTITHEYSLQGHAVSCYSSVAAMEHTNISRQTWAFPWNILKNIQNALPLPAKM